MFYKEVKYTPDESLAASNVSDFIRGVGCA